MTNIFKIEINPNRIFGLDILRALAILFVVIAHGDSLLVEKWRGIIGFFAFDGVSIFFVLSGFLIGGIFIKKIEKDGVTKKTLLDFWIRRWFRTLPNYFLILTILTLIYSLFYKDFASINVGKYIVFSQNLYTQHPIFFQEAWSLSVEEWFYLLTPICIIAVILVSKTTYKRVVLFTAIAFIILVTAFRYYRYSTLGINTAYEFDDIFRKQVVTRLDSLMFGVIGAYLNFYYHKFWVKYKTLLFAFGVFLFFLLRFIIPDLFPLTGLYITTFSFTLASIATLSILPFLSNVKSGKGFFYKIITYLSLISYSLYLLNDTIICNLIVKRMPWYYITDNEYVISIMKYSLFWTLSILLSILLYKYFEIKMTKLRDNEKIKSLISKIT